MAKTKGKWIKDKVVEVPTGTINGSNVTFVLSQVPSSANNLTLYLDGLLETAYSIVLATKTITMNTAPALGQGLKAIYRTN